MIEVIFNFIVENWKVILFLILLLIDVIIDFIRGSKMQTSVLLALVTKLPEFILEAEKTGASGTVKYTKVFGLAVDYLASLTGLSTSKVCAKYSKFIDGEIENILSTPEKKGNKNA